MGQRIPTFLGKPLTDRGHRLYSTAGVAIVHYNDARAMWVAECTILGLAVRTEAGAAQGALDRIEVAVINQFRRMGEALGYEVD